MKIYIAGKISGEDMAQCTMKFGSAYQLIRTLGADAVNPLEVVVDWNITWQMAMRKDIKVLMDCDAIYALPCHKESRGATIEISLAKKLGIQVFFNETTLRANIK